MIYNQETARKQKNCCLKNCYFEYYWNLREIKNSYMLLAFDDEIAVQLKAEIQLFLGYDIFLMPKIYFFAVCLNFSLRILHIHYQASEKYSI